MNIKILILIISAFIFNSCEDKIDVSLDAGVSQLVVDAFVNNLPQKQNIKLTMSNPYFDNSKANSALGAIVKLRDDNGNTFIFAEESNGNYSYTPNPADSFCALGRNYELSITYKGEEFYSNSKVNRVPNIDSIKVRSDPSPFSNTERLRAEFYSKDFKNTIDNFDFYWVKSSRNDSINTLKNSDIIQDGAFSGDGADGLPFIQPMRQTINKSDRTPYFENDTISMQLISINSDTYSFLLEVFKQTTNGGLFATPPANVRTNILNRNTKSITIPEGWFCVSQVKQAGLRIKKPKK
ncbi:MAG: DUF4249 domain-containing protein [Candidatus Kapabacteria bacterium]|nr:DUF4249 domain-containing protein [Candidatus Kapabacteria bacterium]